jgi:Secretion system C-terminal sorting domain
MTNLNKNFSRTMLCGFVLLTSILEVGAQGAIINEFSNGTTGSQEYIELLTIGSTAAPTTPVDLRGWLFDDNNGQYGVGVGVAGGHFRISPTCTNLSAIPVGSLVVFYNAGERNPTIPADDPSDANGDKVYILPHTNSCLEVTATLPTASNSTYLPSSYTAPINASWGNIGFANGGDAVQLRKPDGTFFHGFSWGSATGSPVGTFPSFPIEVGGGSSFDIDTRTGGNMAYIFNCGNYSKAVNFTRQTASTFGNETPGAINNTPNDKIISKIRLGSLDYADLNNDLYCQQPLSVELMRFDAVKENKNVKLEWQIPVQKDFKTCDIQRSVNGFNYESLGSFSKQNDKASYTFLDVNPLNSTGYYRLEMKDNEGKTEYSKTISIAANEKQMFTFAPNPVTDYLSISTEQNEANAVQEVSVFDGVGRLVKSQKMQSDASTIDFSGLNKGIYLVQIKGNNQITHRKIVKQ